MDYLENKVRHIWKYRLKNWKNIHTQKNFGTLFHSTGLFLIPINNEKNQHWSRNRGAKNFMIHILFGIAESNPHLLVNLLEYISLHFSWTFFLPILLYFSIRKEEQPEWIKFTFIEEQITNPKTRLDSSYIDFVWTGPPHTLSHWGGTKFSKRGNFKAVSSNLV